MAEGDPCLTLLVTPTLERRSGERLTLGQMVEMRGVIHQDVNRFVRARTSS